MAKKQFARSDRIADQMQRELADIIRTELKDPRVGWVTLTAVEVTRDYSHAKVFYTVMNSTRPGHHPACAGTRRGFSALGSVAADQAVYRAAAAFYLRPVD